MSFTDDELVALFELQENFPLPRPDFCHSVGRYWHGGHAANSDFMLIRKTVEGWPWVVEIPAISTIPAVLHGRRYTMARLRHVPEVYRLLGVTL